MSAIKSFSDYEVMISLANAQFKDVLKKAGLTYSLNHYLKPVMKKRVSDGLEIFYLEKSPDFDILPDEIKKYLIKAIS